MKFLKLIKNDFRRSQRSSLKITRVKNLYKYEYFFKLKIIAMNKFLRI